MRSHLAAIGLLTLLVAPFVGARDQIPIADFARTPETAAARLSPDGKSLALVREYAGRRTLHVGNLEKGNYLRINLGRAELLNEAEKEVLDFQWIGARRLIVTTMVWDMIHGAVALDSDGRNAVPISGYEDNQSLLNRRPLFNREVIHRFFDKESRVLMLDRHETTPGTSNRPDVLEVNTSTGATRRVLKNPGEVGHWSADANGVVRVGILTHGELSGVIYRDSEQTPWRTVMPLQRHEGELRPIGFDAANDRLFVVKLNEANRWTIFPLQPTTGHLGEALVTHDEYDILARKFLPSVNGHRLCEPVFSPQKEELLGIRYVTDAPRVKWFNREYTRMQVAIDKLSPNTVNFLVDVSLDGNRLLWFGYSDQDPGVYFLADRAKRTLSPLTRVCSWINPAQMAPMLGVKYTARDGLTIHGFLTVPTGSQPRNLPLVVMPHGGPWIRDVWGYDPLVQLLANRGYAVLQMNYRGSPGYGNALYTQARRQIGGQIQEDIEDATRWAIASGVADPQRIAIAGSSYGGYSALFALGQSPGMYRCGISMAGVTDWPAMYKNSDVAGYKDASRHWKEEIGDPKNDLERLTAISPINFPEKINAPVLIIQGKEDRRVPPDQARRMITALEEAGNPPQSLFLNGVAHNFGREKSRAEIYTAIVNFLEKHLGPGA